MRFLVFTMCVAFAAMTSGGAWSQEEGVTDRSATDRSERGERAAEWRQRMLEEFDKDGDGVLDDEERAAMREAMSERRARGEGPRGEGFGGEGPRGPQPPVDFDRLFNRFDEDGDGQLSREEFGKLTEALQARLRGTPPAGRGEGRGEGRGPRGEGRGEGRGPRGEGRGEGRAEGRDDRPGPPAGRRGGGRRPGAEPRDAEATETPERQRGPRRDDGEVQTERRGPGPGRMMNPERLFNRFDEDGDGQLSREEYDKFAEFMTEMRARMQERGPRGEAQEGRPGPPRGEGRGRPGRPQRPPQDEGASDAATEDSDS